MKGLKWALATFATTGLLLAGCGEDVTQPPKSELMTTNNKDKGVLGDYCWEVDGKENCEKGEDIVETLEKAEAIPATIGTALTLAIDSKDRPTSGELEWVTEEGKKGKEKLKGSLLFAPQDKGIYYYTYTAKWDGSGKKGYKGEAEYYYKLRVQ